MSIRSTPYEAELKVMPSSDGRNASQLSHNGHTTSPAILIQPCPRPANHSARDEAEIACSSGASRMLMDENDQAGFDRFWGENCVILGIEGAEIACRRGQFSKRRRENDHDKLARSWPS
eukprot:gnl/MRDRNA2_/MRDRNA2_86299_c0_seq6.p1 gnl/MRDRNA2_/MRDRNA2_86299_c0~~gnl/MRDRNA2_/MRDRNA2_86299_c0_seq6.p1  ORF type:complete len:119 (+),score=2.35 gnl/MRDRNA2_/MRDRNA2_86299_c0_seq6:292-648(+)